MYLQINADAAASTRKGRVQPGAPISGMPGRGSCSSKPAKQVPDPDESPARTPLHGRKTEARRGVCDGPQGPEKTPPALALGREGTRPAHSQVDGWTLVLGRRKSHKASEEEEVQRTLLVWGVTQDTPAQRVRARLSHARAISIDAEVRWAGAGLQRRIEIVFKRGLGGYTNPTENFLPLVKKVCLENGWRCVPARTFATRLRQRDPIPEARQHVEDSMEDERPEEAPSIQIAPWDRYFREEEVPLDDGEESPVDKGADEAEPPPPRRPSRSSRGSLARRRAARRRAAEEDKKQVSHLTLFSLNIQKGFRNKVHEIESTCGTLHADVVALQEVAKNDESTPFKGYTAVLNTAPGEPGLLFLVAPHLCAATTYAGSTKHSYWIRIKGGKNRTELYIANCHMPTKGKTAERAQAFQDVAEMASAFQEEGDVVVLGDMNATLVNRVARSHQMRAQVGMYTDEKTIPNSQHLEKLLQDTGLTSLNGQSRPSETDKQYWWTRYDKPNNTYKCLDYVLVSPALAERAPTFSVHFKHLDSDHCAVTAEVVSPMCFSRRTAKRARRKVFRTDRLLLNSSKSNKKQVNLAVKEYMDELAASFTGFNPGDGPGDSPDTVVQDFIQRTERALENSVGSKWPNPRFSRRWFDDELKELIEERRRAYRSFIDSLQHGDKETSASLWSNFRACRKKCKSATKEKKRAEWEEYIQDVSEAYRRDHKNLWTLLRRVMPDKGKKGRVELTPMQAQDGSLATSEEEIMEVWEDHQRALGTPVTDGWDKDFSRKVRREVEGYASANPQPADEEMDKDFTPAEVKAALDHAENYKSPADDGTTYTMFKQGGAPMV